MKNRLLSTLSIWTIVGIGLYYFDVHAIVWLVAIFSAMTQWELYELLEKTGFTPNKKMGVTLGLLIPIGFFYMNDIIGINNGGIRTDMLLIVLLGCLATMFTRRTVKNQAQSIMSTIFGIIFIPYLLHYLIVLVKLFPTINEGILTVVWLVLISKFTDVGGYVVGSLIGKYKLAPSFSPNKTWEGVIGGIIFSILAGSLFILGCGPHWHEGISLGMAAILCVPIGIAAITSDLIESIFKREAGVKDSGKMIPGIGGAYDLADSVILTAPLGYLLIRYLLL